MTAPQILVHRLNDSSPQWIFVNIANQLEQITVAVNQNRFVTVAKQLTVTPMPPIVALSVNPVDMTHTPGYKGMA
ncbi:MAG: hypothetical protein PHQ97_12010 [Desulfobacterales bacterium]|nr:hypothetical protein [Desulfobacterales bacterium]